MRTKDEILKDARHDITDEQYKTTKANWLEYRKIEVLIDIRDLLVTDCRDAMNSLIEIRNKH